MQPLQVLRFGFVHICLDVRIDRHSEERSNLWIVINDGKN